MGNFLCENLYQGLDTKVNKYIDREILGVWYSKQI